MKFDIANLIELMKFCNTFLSKTWKRDQDRYMNKKQDNAVQQWWYSTILVANAISNNVEFAKMVHPDFFDEDGGRSFHHWLRKSMIVGSRSEWRTIHSTPLFPLYSTYYRYFYSLLPTLSMHCLQSTFTEVKKDNPQLGSNADHSGTA